MTEDSEYMEEVKLMDDQGLRLDGRKVDELRPIKIEAGVLKRADGSAYIEWGDNKILAAVYGPREVHPKHRQEPSRAIVQCRYNMATFSVSERKRPGPDRRSTEISKIISEAFTNVVLVGEFPRTTVDVYIEVLQADAGTRCAGLTAASVALADAGILMKDLITSCAVGKVCDTLVLDPSKEEDNKGQADMPFAMNPRTGDIVLLQMDGHLTFEEFKRALEIARETCKEINKVQQEALRNRYSVVQDDTETNDTESKVVT
jgi:exosome complex component RRP41